MSDTTNQEIQISLIRTYTKDLSFSFKKENVDNSVAPGVSINVATDGVEISPDVFEVVVLLAVSIKSKDDSEIVSFEIAQAGAFYHKNLGQAFNMALFFDGGNALWSSATYTLDSLLAHSGLPPLNLANQDYRVILKKTIEANVDNQNQQEAK